MKKFEVVISLIIFLTSTIIGIDMLVDSDNKTAIALALDYEELSNKVSLVDYITVSTTTTTEPTTTTTTVTTTKRITTSKTTNNMVTTTVPAKISNTMMISGTNKVWNLKKGNASYSDLTNGNKYAVIDNRLNFDQQRVIIYGHSYPNGGGLFNYLQNYDNNPSFYQAHKYITINYDNIEYKYEIFSVYIAAFNDDVSLNDEALDYFSSYQFRFYPWRDKMRLFQSRSQYHIDMELNGSDRILILQTCSMNKEYTSKYDRANLLIFAKLIQ